MVVMSAPTVHINNQNPLTMTSLNSKLQLAMLNRKKSRNPLEKGFTLVELMIVIVIVGVLSAVALPNFLGQTNKAKGTEARSQISSIIKGAAASYLEGGDTKVNTDITNGTAGNGPCSLWGAPGATVTKFDYTCVNGANGLKVTATGNANDTNLQSAVIVHDVDLSTGIVTPNNTETSQMFGGALADPV
ncbi:type IV pilin protein [Synechococcus sp. UW69]|uniref:type IV pilin protein n=1 Tax=Synechococcus sp. UW69 TaxID=368493 RepID=UPI0027387C7C|nr:type II secretion system protein [Synechococcus sp. UW69]